MISKFTQSLIFFSILLTLNANQIFYKVVNRWKTLAIFQGQFQKDPFLFSKSKCESCHYVVAVYKDHVQIIIDVTQQGKQDRIRAFELDIKQNHQNRKFWDIDLQRLKIQKIDERYEPETISRFTRNGLLWDYEFTLPTQGLTLKGRKLISSDFLMATATLLFSLLIFYLLPFNLFQSKQACIQTPRRTPLLSLLIISQVQHLILIQTFIISFKYIIYQKSFPLKFVWALIFLIPFSLIIWQILFIYNSISVRFLKNFGKLIQNSILRILGIGFTFLFGVYCSLIALLIIDKHIWIFCYFSFQFVWQIGWSLKNKTYPYLTINFYYTILIAYQMFLSNFSPLLLFQQNTRMQIIIFWGSLIGVYLLGSLIQKRFIRTQIVSEVINEQQKSVEMSDKRSIKSTQQNINF